MPKHIGYNYPILQEYFYPIKASVDRRILSPMEMTFKMALEQALKVTGKSLRSVAIDAGVSYDQLKNLKQGKAQTTNADDARKVAAAFGVTLDDFYEGRFGQPIDHKDAKNWIIQAYDRMSQKEQEELENFARFLVAQQNQGAEQEE